MVGSYSTDQGCLTCTCLYHLSSKIGRHTNSRLTNFWSLLLALSPTQHFNAIGTHQNYHITSFFLRRNNHWLYQLTFKQLLTIYYYFIRWCLFFEPSCSSAQTCAHPNYQSLALSPSNLFASNNNRHQHPLISPRNIYRFQHTTLYDIILDLCAEYMFDILLR